MPGTYVLTGEFDFPINHLRTRSHQHIHPLSGSGSARFERVQLVDLWARAVTDSLWIRRKAVSDAKSACNSIRAVVTRVGELSPLKSPIVPGLNGAVIYELHVGGFTRHPSSGVHSPGKFLGLIEKIPYLKKLGVTHVELLPVMAFDDQDVPPSVEARGLRNYWGYSPHSFYSPHPRYCVTTHGVRTTSSPGSIGA